MLQQASRGSEFERRVVQAIVVALVFASISWAQAGASGEGAETVAPLKLELKPESTRYCEGNDEMATFRIRGHLEFSNVGRDPLILWKGSERIERVRVARSIFDLQSKHYVQDGSITTV
jgi:hypothetical protein